MNTFLWRYLAQQDAKKAQQGEEARYVAEQTNMQQDRALAQRKQQFAEDEARGETLAMLEQPVKEVASPHTMRGYDTGLAKKKLAQDSFRQALGLKQMQVEAQIQGKLLTGDMANDRARQGREVRVSEGELNRNQSDINNKRIADAMKQRGYVMQEDRTDRAAERLAKMMESFPAMKADLTLLQNEIKKPTAPAGVGPIVGRVPTEALALVGQNDAVRNRMAAQRLLNALIYASTGKALNEEEMVRALEARGLDGKSPAKFKEGINSLVQELRTVMSQKEAGFSYEVNQEYGRRPGAVTSQNFVEQNAPEDDEDEEPDDGLGP